MSSAARPRESMGQKVDAEVERPGRERDRHERAYRKDEEEGTDHAGRGVLDAVHPVHRREQQLPDPAAEIDWRGHVTEGVRNRTARGVALVFARGNEKGRDPYEDGRQNGRGHNG